jgi:hypothetical protein
VLVICDVFQSLAQYRKQLLLSKLQIPVAVLRCLSNLYLGKWLREVEI